MTIEWIYILGFFITLAICTTYYIYTEPGPATVEEARDTLLISLFWPITFAVIFIPLLWDLAIFIVRKMMR